MYMGPVAGVVTAASLVNIYFEYRKITQLLDLVEVRPVLPCLLLVLTHLPIQPNHCCYQEIGCHH
jgi:hypothetical protein